MKVNILGIDIDQVTLPQAMQRIGEWINSDGQHLLVTVNPEITVAAQTNKKYKDILNSASLATCDGTGLQLAAKILHGKHLTRVTGVDLTLNLLNSTQNCHGALLNNAAIYLLGGEAQVAVKLKEKFSQANIVGAESGGKLFKESDQQWILKNNADVIKRINDSGANILLVAFGGAKQEIWISDNLARMPGVKAAIGIGGTFDYLSGKVKRPPLWIRKIGLEWLYRLVIMPQRAGRIYNATFKFCWMVLMEKIKNNKNKY